MDTKMIAALGGWRSKRTGRAAVGVIGLMAAIGYTIEATGMPLGTQGAPGPAMFPIVVGVAAAIISVVVVVEALKRPAVEEDIDIPSGTQRRNVLGFAGATVLLVVLLPVLGQYIAASLYATAMVKVLSPHGWLRSVAYGVLTGVAISWIFIEMFSVRLPTGLLGPDF